MAEDRVPATTGKVAATGRVPATGEPRHVRASDAEREEVVTVLRTAIGEGRLTLAEGEERIAGVYAARFRDEFGQFTADLPGTQPPIPAPWAVSGAAGPQPRADVATRYAVIGAVVPMAMFAVMAALFITTDGHAWQVFPVFFLCMLVLRRVAWARRAAAGDGYRQRRPGAGHHGQWPAPPPYPGGRQPH